MACLPLSELILCRLKTQSRRQERKSSMAFDLEDQGEQNLYDCQPRPLESFSQCERVWRRTHDKERGRRGGGRVAFIARVWGAVNLSRCCSLRASSRVRLFFSILSFIHLLFRPQAFHLLCFSVGLLVTFCSSMRVHMYVCVLVNCGVLGLDSVWTECTFVL